MFGLESRMTDVKFKGCRIILDCKIAIMKELKGNYTIRNLDINDANDQSNVNTIRTDSSINKYLCRNKVRYLCRLASLELILIRKHRNNHLLNCLDKSVVLYLAKMIYNTRTDRKSVV